MIQDIDIRLLCRNTGQIEGLPKNPRFIRDEKFELLKKSIQENPEMLSLRELLVYPVGEQYIVIGGNMRLEACKALGYKTVPCKVLDADTTVEQLKAYTVKDNAGFGEWDWDMLANEWDSAQLTEWGVDVPEWSGANSEDFGEEFSLKDGEKAPFQQMTFQLADAQAELIKKAIESAKKDERYKRMDTNGNTNTNGNALSLIVSMWAENCTLWGDAKK